MHQNWSNRYCADPAKNGHKFIEKKIIKNWSYKKSLNENYVKKLSNNLWQLNQKTREITSVIWALCKWRRNFLWSVPKFLAHLSQISSVWWTCRVWIRRDRSAPNVFGQSSQTCKNKSISILKCFWVQAKLSQRLWLTTVYV